MSVNSVKVKHFRAVSVEFMQTGSARRDVRSVAFKIYF